MLGPPPMLVVIDFPGVNPLPATATEAPLGPSVGDSVIVGNVIVNPVVALSKLPSEPVAFTVYAVEDAVPEIVTEQLNVPDPLTVASHVVIDAPPLIVVVIVLPGVNPAPDAVAVTPLGPNAGARLSESPVTVNDAVALSKEPSVPVAVIE